MSSRYARQETLWGTSTQQRLRASTVAVIGAGGLGSPALLYLAGAGVGRILLFDDDTVSLSNLHRQVIHSTATVGQPKTDSAAAALNALNPECTVEQFSRLTPDTALEQLHGADLIIDGTDNFYSRHLASWAAHELGIPHVWASLLGYDAQLTVFHSGHGPVYEDLFPTDPQVPSCSQAGVMGPVVGVAGSALAVEALKLLTGIGTPLIGTLGYYDSLAGTWEYIPVRANGATPARPDNPTDIREIPENATLIDVRTSPERAASLIPGSQHLPLDDILAGHNPPIDPADLAVLYCASGLRSAQAVEALRARGFSNVYSLRGGIDAWQEHISELETEAAAAHRGDLETISLEELEAECGVED
ncbi:ThiF family adenylyltransferase [Corynebacterium sp. HMSC078H07]|uniref:ThiF family adenylyltransferase n=1 Tax=Corynebacterium sp. HMSC078H07 TaxID=1739379 RepID=UPI000AEC4873|nr:ThiF family adenylyltransferase [Corynebacterium sp. HMSC078H07]